MLTQLKQFYYFYETEVINVKINDATDRTTSDRDDTSITEID
uniref:Uncharacterized protein n=1 Tax=viral metagenome TaxID=1070528 RepID=A0A6C0LEG6_9ZZZZ